MQPPAPSASARTWRSRSVLVTAFVVVAAAWRMWLAGRYGGWEESDYGNLAMVRGVLDGGFRHYDMNHMPGYYALGALALAVVGDAVVAARLVSLVGGLVALGLSISLTDRLFGRLAAVWAGAVLVFQPEFALYAATSLREPVYAAFVVGTLVALLSERLAVAGCLAGAAFLVRFDAALVLGPVLMVHALGRGPRARRGLLAIAPLLAVIGLWSVYTRIDHGTFAFWSHAVAVNVETGQGGGSGSAAGWLASGVEVAGTLAAWVLPWRIGWGVWAGLAITAVTTPWVRHGGQRTIALAGLLLAGLWCGIGLTAQHEPGHNLYWKWMMPLVPVLVPLGVGGAVRAFERLAHLAGPAAAAALGVLVAAQGLVSHGVETRRQVTLSAELYLPQLALGRWIESSVPEPMPLLVDNIPACWLDRRPHDRPLTSWFDVPSAPGDGAAFARWLLEARIGWVLWFREEWTQAPRVAPFLSAGGVWSEGGVTLVQVADEPSYGWRLYRVEGVGEGAPPPTDPPTP